MTNSGKKTEERPEVLMARIGGERGPLGPMVKMLKRLMDDPILKQAMVTAPAKNKNH